MDGTVLGVAPRLMPGREIVFRLERQPAVEANRAMWVRLLGDPIGRGRDRSAPISLELTERPLPYGTVDSAKSDEALEAKITLSAYHIGLMWVGGLAALAAAIAVIFACASTTAMRDSAVPQMLVLDRPFSLGRFQMAVWFTLILMSFLFIFVVTLDLNSISAESFVLLGISGTTALAAVAVDQNKDSPLARIQQSLTDMGLKTRHDIELLDNAKKKKQRKWRFPSEDCRSGRNHSRRSGFRSRGHRESNRRSDARRV